MRTAECSKYKLTAVWLTVKAAGLVMRLSWGITKVLAGLLVLLAFPALILCLLFFGGVALIIPAVIICAMVGVLDSRV